MSHAPYCRKKVAIAPLLAAFILSGTGGVALAQEADEREKAQEQYEKQFYDFWENTPFTKQTAAVELVAAQNPFTVLALRAMGKHYVVWGLEEDVFVNENTAPRLDRRLLSALNQWDDKIFPDIRRKLPEEVTELEKAVIEAYTQALLSTALTAPEKFKFSAQGNEWISWGHMYREPWKYRGEVVPIEGRLVRIRKEEAPLAAKAQGVHFVYEGWVFMDTHGTNPVCVLFAHLPDGVKPAERMDRRITAYGYFFYRYRYLAADGHPHRTLLFFAPTFEVESTRAVADQTPSRPWDNIRDLVLMGIFILGGGTLVLILGLTWWFRRNDLLVRKRLDALRASQMLAPHAALETERPLASRVRPPEEEATEPLTDITEETTWLPTSGPRFRIPDEPGEN